MNLTLEQTNLIKTILKESFYSSDFYFINNEDVLKIHSAYYVYQFRVRNYTEEQLLKNNNYFKLFVNLFDVKINNSNLDKNFYLKLDVAEIFNIKPDSLFNLSGISDRKMNRISHIKINYQLNIDDFNNFINYNDFDYNLFDKKIKEYFIQYDKKETEIKENLKNCIESRNKFITRLNIPIEFM